MGRGLIVGIDPGFTGAIAFLEPDTRELCVVDMPTTSSSKGKNRTVLDLPELFRVLDRSDLPAGYTRYLSLLEIASPRPKEGVSSSFRSGQGYGSLDMALTAHQWERHLVTPASWKKHFRLSQDKNASRNLACQRFPDYTGFFSRQKDHGRAEASLIALYASETIL